MSHRLYGYWQWRFNPGTGELDIIPFRTSELHINIAGVLNNTWGLGVKINHAQSDFPNGILDVDVSITHPFPGLDNYSGFDVRGILISSGVETPSGIFVPGNNDPRLLNADGYTRWWNPTDFTTPGLLGYTPGNFGKNPPSGITLSSNINGYKQFADSLYLTHPIDILLTVSPTAPNGRSVFKSGNTNSRKYRIQFPVNAGSPVIYFNYAIDASWASPNENPPVVPNDFPMNANCPEAFMLKPKVTDSSLWAVGGAPQGGGEISLEIEAWDWQGMYGSYTGQFGALVLYSPDAVFSTGIMPNVSAPGSGKAILTATIPGNPTKQGQIDVWVGVTAAGTNYKQGSVPAPNAPIAAFTRVTANVAEPECANNGNNNCSTSEPVNPQDVKTGLLCLNVDTEDWYAFTVDVAGLANGTIHLSSYNLNDLSLYLYKNCPGVMVDFSTVGGYVDEEIVLHDLGPGDYFIRVIAVDNGDPAPKPYKLTTDITGLGADCTFDNDNIPGDAGNIEYSDSQSETVCLVGDPVDWYTFQVSPGSSVYGTVTLQNNNYANNDCELYQNPSLPPIYSGNNPGNVDENLDVTFLSGGTYYLKVQAKHTSPSGDRPFTVITDLTEVIADCNNEDGNNTPDEADTLQLLDGTGGTVCFPSDPDWYKFTAPGEGVDGSIKTLAFGASNIDLALYDDPSNAPIAESANPGNVDEVIEVQNLEPGTYYIMVTAGEDFVGINQSYGIATELFADIPGALDFYIHAHIVRTSNGSDPATSIAKVQSDIDWADQFWGKWLGANFTASAITYINNTSWLSCTTSEADQMFEQYSSQDGALNIFYVNDTPDMPGAAAYALMDCRFEFQDHTWAYIIINDLGDDATFAHEFGHAAGLLGDMYLLDFYDCYDVTWCWTPPSDIFCLESDATWGNIMYWPIGDDVDNYWASDDDLDMSTYFIDSQSENIKFFNTNYPNAFYEP